MAFGDADYTEFNGDAATRVDGRSLSRRIAEAGTKDPGTRIVDEMLNPKVQVYGDTAILSYNFFGLEQEGWEGEAYAGEVFPCLRAAGR